MFGIEKLREEIYDLKDSVEELNQRFQTYTDEKLTFAEMQTYLNDIVRDFEDRVEDKLDDILKRLPALPNGKDKKK